MASKRPDLYQCLLRDVKEYVTVCDQAGFGHSIPPADQGHGSPELLSMYILHSFELFATKVMPRFASA